MTRDYAAERYNRRTRAIERQADALARIADALTVSAIADAANTKAPHLAGSRAWTEERASILMRRLSEKEKGLR